MPRIALNKPKIPCGNSVTKNNIKTANNILVVRSVCFSLSICLLFLLGLFWLRLLASSPLPFVSAARCGSLLPVNAFRRRFASNNAAINRRLRNVSAIHGISLMRTENENKIECDSDCYEFCLKMLRFLSKKNLFGSKLENNSGKKSIIKFLLIKVFVMMRKG